MRSPTPDSSPSPTPPGPYTAVPHGTRWTLEYALEPHRHYQPWDTQQQAHQHAQQLNQQWHTARQPRPPKPTQPALFDTQEVAG